MTLRQEKILGKIVKEYIRTAHPVGSAFLEKKCKFGLSTATIRNEMNSLSKEGYLSQPHTSSGRVPTAKGYRFFVDNFLLKNPENDFSIIDDILENKKVLDIDIKMIEEIIKKMALVSSNLVFAYLLEEDIFLASGWSAVLKNPEFEEKEFLEDFLCQFDILEKEIKELFGEFEDFDVCIGKEKPFINFDNFSLIVSKNSLPNVYLGILGPSRMEYDKNINLILKYEYGRNKKRA